MLAVAYSSIADLVSLWSKDAFSLRSLNHFSNPWTLLLLSKLTLLHVLSCIAHMSNETPTLTTEQESELKRLKAFFPYRICFAAISKDGTVAMYAKPDRRTMNSLIRKGYHVYSLS